jgi:uncharacterized membrane protein YciS (DUF1049 family)
MSMGFIKWVIVFVISFAIAFIIIVNFSKPEFGVLVPAWFFFYQTKPHPVWVYVSFALGLGLLAGLSVATYYFITLRAAIFKKDRQIKKLESERGMAAAPPAQAEEQIEPAGDDSF